MTSSNREVMEYDAEPSQSWFPTWMSWRPTSAIHLFLAEARLLSRLDSHIESFYIPIFNSKERIRTLLLTRKDIHPFDAEHRQNPSSADYLKRCPIVLVHGMAAGTAMWIKNLDALAEHRPVYCFDLLGFGRSSRPCDMPPSVNKKTKERWLDCNSDEVDFDDDQMKAYLTELQFVKSIEEWRNQIGLTRMILVGHSLGGYLSFAYSLRYPERVSHLVLADPWGFSEYQENIFNDRPRSVYVLYSIAKFLLKTMNPLSVLRVTGPFGPSLLKRFRPDLANTFTVQKSDDEVSPPPDETDESKNVENGCILDYIYHINAQYPASGETAFKALSKPIPWAALPMGKRVGDLSSTLPVSFIYGSRSWMDSSEGENVKFTRGTSSSTTVWVLDGAGHHVYAQAHEPFNEIVIKIGNSVPDLTSDEMKKNDEIKERLSEDENNIVL